MNDFLSDLPDSRARVDPPLISWAGPTLVSLNIAYFLLV